MLPIFTNPKFDKIDFRKYLNLQRQDYGVIDQATAARKKFAELGSKKSDFMAASNVISAIDQYLPHLIALRDWAEKHIQPAAATTEKGEKKEEEKVFKASIPFTWHSCFSSKSSCYVSYNDFDFELAMTLAARAGFLWENARGRVISLAPALVNGSNSTHLQQCSEAAMFLREAAGIWTFLSSTQIPKVKLVSAEGKHSVPPELSAIFCDAMSNLCLGTGQLLAYIGSAAPIRPDPVKGPDGRPVDSGKDDAGAPSSPLTLCSSILADYPEKLSNIEFTLDSQKDLKKTIPDCFGDVSKKNGYADQVIIPLCNMLCYICCGKHAWSQNNYGEAVGYLRAANGIYKTFSGKALSKLEADARVLYELVKHEMEVTYETYQKENSFIYKHAVPASVSLPQPRSLVKKVDYALPEPMWTSLPSKI